MVVSRRLLLVACNVAWAAVACGGANNPAIGSPKPNPNTLGREGGAADASLRDAELGREASHREAEAGGSPATDASSPFSSVGPAVAIGDQFLFTEGPVWDPKDQVLYFSDTNADIVYRLTLPDQFDVLLQPAGKPDGLALDPQGRLIAAGFASRDVWRLDRSDGGADGGVITTLASTYQGNRLNSPDDLIARSDGVIYFTDSTFGINGTQGFPVATAELAFQGVFRIAADGSLHVEDQTTSQPNGVVLSPDERILYVSYTSTGEIAAFDVADDGVLGNKRSFATAVLADSMCVDSAGDVYVAAASGIAVFSPTGTPLATIPVGEIPTNPSFGGPDQRTLFVTARRNLIGVPTAGNSSLYRIDHMPIPGLPGRP